MNELKYKIENGQVVNKSSGVAIPDDEPLFILRAKDRKAIGCLLSYQAICDDLNHKASVQNTIEAFRVFQVKFPERMKEPDTPPEY